MIITIHQPNFVPWYPFFEKMMQADVFIILGHCQFEKNGYQNRFFLKHDWNTMSVIKGMYPIKDKIYANPYGDWSKIKNKLSEYSDILTEMDPYISNNLYRTNVSIIKHLAKKLNITTDIVEDYPTDLTSTDRLVDLCKHYGGTTYLAGQGGKSYLDENKFTESGIRVIYQEDFTNIHTLDFLKYY